MSDRDIRMVAADAARLRDDPALWLVLSDLEGQATRVAIGDIEPAARERARNLALAIMILRQDLQDRIDGVLIMEENRRRARASE